MTVKKSSIDHSLDSILIKIGDFGKYQILVIILICFAVIAHSAIHVAYVFTAMDLDYRCKIPECDSPTNSHYMEPWLINAVPLINGRPTKCTKYSFFENSTLISNSSSCSSGKFDKNIVEQCKEFVYDSPEKTILQEFNLQCNENLWKLTLVGTVNNIGQFFGLTIVGIFSDKFGRKLLLVWSLLLCSTAGCIKTFVPSYEWFLLFEFLEAALGCGIYMCGFVLAVELVTPRRRVLMGTIICCCYAVGEVLIAIAAHLAQSWRILVFICYVPPLLCFTYFWLVPESIRWNLNSCRIDEAKKTLKKLATFNGKQITDKDLEILDTAMIGKNDSNENLENFSTAFKSGKLMFRLVICCFCWISCAFSFYGLTLNSVSLNGNRYVDFMLTALVEIPAYIACNFTVDSMGRKNSLFGSYFLTGAACLAFVFLPPTSDIGRLLAYLLGKFGSTAAFTVIYVITSEMFPTNLRNSFMGTCSTFGRCGSILAPQVPLLAQIWEPLPSVSFAIVSIIAGVLTFVFPETVNRKLPDTVKEAEDIGKSPILKECEPSPYLEANQLEKY